MAWIERPSSMEMATMSAETRGPRAPQIVAMDGGEVYHRNVSRSEWNVEDEKRE